MNNSILDFLTHTGCGKLLLIALHLGRKFMSFLITRVLIRFKAYAAEIGGCQRSEDGGSASEGSIDSAGA